MVRFHSFSEWSSIPLCIYTTSSLSIQLAISMSSLAKYLFRSSDHFVIELFGGFVVVVVIEFYEFCIFCLFFQNYKLRPISRPSHTLFLYPESSSPQPHFTCSFPSLRTEVKSLISHRTLPRICPSSHIESSDSVLFMVIYPETQLLPLFMCFLSIDHTRI